MDVDRRLGKDPQGGHHREAERTPGGRPVIIGLTGAMGAGKTSVARLLSGLGAHVIDADAVARQVTAPGMPAVKQIRAAFGDGVFSGGGGLCRSRLAEIVFSDPVLLGRLESILHPRILDRVRGEISALDGRQVVVVDAPLLIESGYHREVDQLWVVVAPAEARLARVVERGGIAHREAERRMKFQLSQEGKAALADVIIDNSGPWAETEGQVRRAWDGIRRHGR